MLLLAVGVVAVIWRWAALAMGGLEGVLTGGCSAAHSVRELHHAGMHGRARMLSPSKTHANARTHRCVQSAHRCTRYTDAQVTKQWDKGRARKPASGPKHGRRPDGKRHAGGNTWAGGTGGRDTAGLGGKGGPYRLDLEDGHEAHPPPRHRRRCMDA